jgi:isopentenyl diphosphate isomerase/L-lactate dehydrogenase-like FMN-dependent dehydrogenase
MIHMNDGLSIAVGRPFMYWLAVGGEQGVEEVLRSLLADAELTLGLSGYKCFEEIWAKRGEILRERSTRRQDPELNDVWLSGNISKSM